MNIQKLIETSKVNIDEAAKACFMFFQGVFVSIISKDEAICIAEICEDWAKRSESEEKYASYRDIFAKYQESFKKHFEGYGKDYLGYAQILKREFPDSDYTKRVIWLANIMKGIKNASKEWNDIAA